MTYALFTREGTIMPKKIEQVSIWL